MFNEASLQLQLATIHQTLGELYEETPDELFNIELEKNVTLSGGTFIKGKTEKAKIDIWFSLENLKSGGEALLRNRPKYFEKANHREPNNRYDVFKDLHNLERYGGFVNVGFLLVATVHPHYINQEDFSPETQGFDFREGRSYSAGAGLVFRTQKPYGPSITLKDSYDFSWRAVETGLSFLFIAVEPFE